VAPQSFGEAASKPEIIDRLRVEAAPGEVVVALASCLHDVGISIHRTAHENYSLILAERKARELLDGLYGLRERTIIVAETLHAVIAHRWDMANRVWAKMKASDSRECRSCHGFAHMDLTEQSRSARSKHGNAPDKGQTCIDCHKGIAHDMGFRAFQIALPPWGALNDDEYVTYFKDVCGSFPDAKFIHYNLPRPKRVLLGPEYRRLEEAVPNLAGTKNTPPLSSTERAKVSTSGADSMIPRLSRSH